MADDDDDALQRSLVRRLGEVQEAIAKLTAEKAALERLITHEAVGSPSSTAGARRNSTERLLVEQRVVELLRRARTPIYGRFLLKEIRSLLPGMKAATFRSHMHRMKAKGIVAPGGRDGFWVLGPEVKVTVDKVPKP